MELSSVSGCQLNLDALYQICPSCFTEVRDAKSGGVITRKVDFKKLRELLGDQAFDEADEQYGFTWVGKNAARREAAKVCHKTLRPCPEESVDWNTTENLYIEGDNLEVLKLLQKSYLGKVKMIYIDPPYNTGNDFVYFDSFKIEDQDYELSAGNIDEQGNRLRKNTDTNARFHSDWCSMIYERLLVARSLLTEDGVIFISIDDNEQKNLKNVCDEVFGEKNFVAQLIWERAFSPKNDARFVSNSHDYVLMLAKDINQFVIGRLERTAEANSRYSNPDNDPRGVWMSSDISVKTYNKACDYPITTPSGKVIEPPAGRCWRLSKNAFFERLRDNRIWFGPNGDNTPRIKRFLSELKFEGMAPTSILFFKDVGHSQEGAQEVVSLFGDKGVFDGPKPVRLLQRLITLANLKKDSIVLDFFSGSASTAHALIKQNAENQLQCKYILVQIPEQVSDSKKDQGYTTICEIGKERIRRAGKKIKEDNADKPGIENLDTGFRVFKCEESFMNEVYFNPAELEQDTLFKHVDNVKTGTTDMQLLFGCMLDWGVQLSLPLTDFEVEGKTIYNVNDGDLVACFAHDINEAVIAAIAELQPLRVVFRDSCFSEAALKMNLFELFKQRCGWSEEQVQSRVHVI